MSTPEDANDELVAYQIARWGGTEFHSFADETVVTDELVERAEAHSEIMNDPIGRWLIEPKDRVDSADTDV